MKRRLYLYPLMAFTAATFVLAGCDDKKDQDQTAAGTEATTPAGDQAMTSTMPSATDTTGATGMTTAPVAAAVTAEGATAYATTEGTTTGAVFLTLHNTGSEADRLIGASSDKSTVEIHENTVGPNGTSQMRKVDAIDVPAGQQVTLKADGYHLMLTGLSQPLMQGDTFNVTLDFEKAPDVTVPVTIVAPGDSAGTMTMDHSAHGDAAPGMASDSAVTTSPDAATTAPAGDMSSDTTGTGASTDATSSESGTGETTGAAGTSTDTGSMPSDMSADEQSAE